MWRLTRQNPQHLSTWNHSWKPTKVCATTLSDEHRQRLWEDENRAGQIHSLPVLILPVLFGMTRSPVTSSPNIFCFSAFILILICKYIYDNGPDVMWKCRFYQHHNTPSRCCVYPDRCGTQVNMLPDCPCVHIIYTQSQQWESGKVMMETAG